MKITDLLKKVTIDLNATASSKEEAIKKAVKLMGESGVISDIDAYEKGVFKREEESTTGIGEGIAIPHCKSDAVKKPGLVAMVYKDGVDFDSLDGEKVHLLFLIAAPNTKENVHLDVLARLSNMLMHEEFKEKLLKAKDSTDFLKIIDDAEASKKEEEANKVTVQYPDLLAATACPTGIAHTYMAQESLEKAAKEKGLTIKVETNGSGGTKNKLTDEEIEHAKAIIVAADAAVETERFIGKKVIQCSVSTAIHNPSGLIDSALSPNTPIFGDSSKAKTHKKSEENAIGASKFHIFYKHLMSGISHMIPFVVAGGIILALAYLIDGFAGVPATAKDFGSHTTAAQIFHFLGADLGLGLMLPILAGFIAYDIAGRPAIVSGFVGGFAASKGTFSLLYFITTDPELKTQLANSAAGFLGAIVAGFLAGYLTLLFKNKVFGRISQVFEGLRDILLLPLITTFIVGCSMLLINVPLAYVNIGIYKGLMALNNIGLTLLLAALVSALMATDMGGPINKAAHYSVLMIMTIAGASDPTAQKLMCANIVGIMTPPVGIALCTWLFPHKFTRVDRDPSIANCVTGLCGITEGAIPYLAKDPVRTLIATVSGAAVGGLISFVLGGLAIAPEGGTISMITMGTICWVGIVSMLIGSLVTCLIMGLLRKPVPPQLADLGKWKGIPTTAVDNFFASIENKKASKKENKDNK